MERTRRLIACSVQQDTCRKVPVQRIVFRVRQESINILKEKKHVQIVKMDVRRTLLATIKASVCCVLSGRRHHELAVLSANIVALEDMVLVASSAKQVNIANLRWTILRLVPIAVSEDINLTMGKQAAFHAHQEGINTLKEKRHVWTAKWEGQPT